ncbi:MAG: hypothetical protein ACP5QZ_07900 [Candidatus Sumerlaeaceae bacterium]
MTNDAKTLKRQTPLLVTCRLKDCYFFEGVKDAELGRALCSHPEKERYLGNGSCPLYRFDWQGTLAKNNGNR